MISLQQVSYTKVRLLSRSEDICGDDVIVAVHRRSNVFLMKRNSSYDVCHQQDKGEWKTRNSWIYPANHSEEFPFAVATIAIEALDAFLLLFSGPKTSHAVFIDLQGNLLNDINLAQRVLCADVDQHRKELIMGLPGGRIVSYAIRFNIKRGPDGTPTDASQYIVILRKHILLSTLEPGRAAGHISISDVTGVCYVLMKGGGIIALETSCLEVLWHVERNRFVYTPERVWADRFGLDFLVLCRDESTEEDGGAVERETLEYWTAPVTMAECDSNQFGRVSIPVSGLVYGAAIESTSIGPLGQELLISVFTRNHRVQLWRALGGQGQLRLHSDLALHRSMEDVQAASSAQLFRDPDSFQVALPSTRTRLAGSGLCCFIESPTDMKNESSLSILACSAADVVIVSLHRQSALEPRLDDFLTELSHIKHDTHIRNAEATAIARLSMKTPVPRARTPIQVVIDTATGAEPESGLPTAESTSLKLSLYTSHEMDDHIDDARPDSERSSQSTFSVDITRKDGSKLNSQSSMMSFTMPILSPLKHAPPDVVIPAAEPEAVVVKGADPVVEEEGTMESLSRGISRGLAINTPRSPSQGRGMEAWTVPKPQIVLFSPLLLLGNLILSSFSLQWLQSHSTVEECFLKLLSPPMSMLFSLPPAGAIIKPAAGPVLSTSTAPLTTGHTVGPPATVTAEPTTHLKVITAAGFVEPHFPSSELANKTMECRLYSIAYGMGVVGVVTAMNECFLAGMGPLVPLGARAAAAAADVAHHRPIRLPVDIRTQAVATVLTLADVNLLLPIDKEKEKLNSSKRQGQLAAPPSHSVLEGLHTLNLIGDSDGMVHITLTTKHNVVSSAILRAHSSPVVAVLTTGNSLKPLWRVGVQLKPQDGKQHVPNTSSKKKAGKLEASAPVMLSVPVAVPGSALVTVARDGEVKIWQPVFSATTNAQAHPDQVFSIFKIQWVVSGMYTCCTGNRGPYSLPIPSVFYARSPEETSSTANQVTKACLDPTCMTLLTGFGDGRLEQWPLPGLIYSPSCSLATCKMKMWATKAHKGVINDIRSWTHLANTTVGDVCLDSVATTEIAEVGKKAVRHASIIRTTSVLNSTIAYTMSSIRNIAEASTLVTSCDDKSIVLWMFILTDEPLELVPGERDMNVYMQPFPCKRFIFSDVPTAGICFSNSKFDNCPTSIWRVSAIVSGAVLTALEATRTEMLHLNGSVAAEYIEDNSKALEFPFDSTPRSKSSQELMVLPTCGAVLKPLRTMDAVSRCQTIPNKPKIFVWDIYEHWVEPAHHTSQVVVQNFGFMDDVIATPFTTRPKSPTSADLQFAPSPTRGSTRHSVKSPPKTAHVPMALGEVVIAMGNILDEALTRDAPVSPTASSRAGDGQSQSSNREKVVINGIRMEIPMNDDDDTVHTVTSAMNKSSPSARRFLATDAAAVVDAVEMDHMLLSKADAMWERLTAKLDSASATSANPEDSWGSAPIVVAHKKRIESKSPTRDIRSPNEVQNDVELVMEPGVPDTARSSLPSARGFSPSRQPSFQLDNNLIAGVMNPPPLVPRSASPKLRENVGLGHHIMADSLDSSPMDTKKPAKEKDKSLNRTAQLRLEQQMKEKERQQYSSKKKQGITYTSKRSISKVLSDMNKGTKQVQGNFSTFTPPPNYFEHQLAASMNRVVIEKHVDPDFDSMEALQLSQQSEDDNNELASFNDESTGLFSVKDEFEPQPPIPRRANLRVSKLGLVFHEPNTDPDSKDHGHVEASIERTESYAGISTYFSRSTKPIVVKRAPAPMPKRLVSKRHEKPADTKVEDEDDDYVIEIEDFDPKVEAPIEPTKAADEDEEFLKMLEGLSPEEQAEMRAKRSLFGTASTLMNLMRATKVSKMTDEFDEPQVQVAVQRVETTSAALDVSSPDGGRVIVLLMSREAPAPSLSGLKHFTDQQSFLCDNPDVLEMKVIQLARGVSNQTLMFDSLRPETPYRVMSYIDSSSLNTGPKPSSFKNPFSAKAKPTSDTKNYSDMTAEAFESTAIEVVTSKEDLEIDWDRMTIDQQNLELRAACRSKVVQEAAKHSSEIMDLPTDGEIALRRTPDGGSLNLQSFVKWWVDPTLGSCIARKKFQAQEAICAARDKDILLQYKKQTKVTDEQLAELTTWVVATQSRLNSLLARKKTSAALSTRNFAAVAGVEVEDETLNEEFDYPQFRHFRSWFKGGNVCFDTVLELAVSEVMARPQSGSTKATSRPNTAALGSDEMRRAIKRQGDELNNIKLTERGEILTNRIALYDECLARVCELVAAFKYTVDHKLQESDLTIRRSKLSDEEVLLIMSALKLTEIFYIRAFSSIPGRMPDASLVGGASGVYSNLKILGSDVFDENNPLFFKPNEPPVFIRATIAGTNRRPIKPWQQCSEAEKQLELSLACSLDYIILAAVAAGVTVPDPEDLTLDPKVFLLRAARWKAFTAWYTGAEGTDMMPGRGEPTEMRTRVSELWERKALEGDSEIFNRMVQLGYQFSTEAVPQDLPALTNNKYTPFSMEAPLPAVDYLARISEELSSAEAKGVWDLNALREDSSIVFDGFSAYVDLYDSRLTLPQGIKLRFDMLRRYVDILMLCRRTNIFRLLCPPGPTRVSHQYAFPQSGVIMPKLEFPPKRYHLFPKRKNVCYTREEMMKWYSTEELDDEDAKMEAAELIGQKRRKYLEWLAQEAVRQVQTRSDMLDEDRQSRKYRKYWQELDKRMKESEESMRKTMFSTKTFASRKSKKLEGDEDMDEGVDEGVEDAESGAYSLSVPIPDDCDFLKIPEDDPYRFGSGTENDDELEDYKEAMRLAAMQREEEEKAMKHRMLEERLRKEKEEALRLKREEQDRRLEEGMERRRHAREKFEDLKAKRLQDAEEARRIQQEKLIQDELMRQEAERIAAINLAIQIELDNQRYENECMGQEEFFLREIITMNREQSGMEEEDILSSLREMSDEAEEKVRQDRVEYLKKLYEPFVPFEFKKVRLPMLHAVLAPTSAVDGVEGPFDHMFPKGHTIRTSSKFADERPKSASDKPYSSSLLTDPRTSTSGMLLTLPDSREALQGATIVHVPKKPSKLRPINKLTPAEKLLRLTYSDKIPNYVDKFLGKMSKSTSVPALKPAYSSSQGLPTTAAFDADIADNGPRRKAKKQAIVAHDDNASVGSLNSLNSLLESEDDVSYIAKTNNGLVSSSLAFVERAALKEKQRELTMASLSSLGEGGGTLLPLTGHEHFLVPGLSGIRGSNKSAGPKKKTSAFYAKVFGDLDFKAEQERKALAAEAAAASESREGSRSQSPMSMSSRSPKAMSTRDGASSPTFLNHSSRMNSSREPLLSSRGGALSSRAYSSKGASRAVSRGDGSFDSDGANSGGESSQSTVRERAKAIVIPVENGVPRPDLLPLARAAAETAEKLQSEREAIREYINSNAYMKDKFFLAASIPVIRDAPYLDQTLGPTREFFAQPKYSSISAGEGEGLGVDDVANELASQELKLALDAHVPPNPSPVKKAKTKKVPKVADTRQTEVKLPFHRGNFGVKGKVAEITKVPMDELLAFKLNRKTAVNSDGDEFRAGGSPSIDRMSEQLMNAITSDSLLEPSVGNVSQDDSMQPLKSGSTLRDHSSSATVARNRSTKDFSGVAIDASNDSNSINSVDAFESGSLASRGSSTILTCPPLLPNIPLVNLKTK